MLPRMLNSLFAQTFLDFEVLLIDDGSTDDSSILCDKYAEKDNRIRVFHTQNEGVAMARQLGIENAEGEYCIHADADDWVESVMLEEMYGKAQEDDADVVIADYFMNKSIGEFVVKQCPSSMLPQTVLQDMFNNKIFGALWHKLIRTELYRKYELRFFHGINHCEDLLIWVQLLQHSDVKIAYLSKAFYHYWSNENSITRHFTRRTYEMRLRFRDKLKELLYLSDSQEIMDKASFGIFTEAFIYNVLTKAELNSGLKQYKKQIRQQKSLKWRIGFMMLEYGLNNIAHKLIHY